LQRAKHYPRIAKRARQEGRVVLEVVIDGNGNILSVNVSDSSGYPLLDEAAQRSIEAIGKLPSPPRELTWERKVLHVPYLFRLT
jgi:protein TonB